MQRWLAAYGSAEKLAVAAAIFEWARGRRVRESWAGSTPDPTSVRRLGEAES